MAGLRAAFSEVLSDDNARRTLQYSTTEGDPRLRALVAALMTARGIPSSVDDILVTSGSQQALTLIATALVEPGDVVLVEDPTYMAALQCHAYHVMDDCPGGRTGRIKIGDQWVERPSLSDDGKPVDGAMEIHTLPKWWVWR